jgi:hypothetical protein
MTSSPTDRYRSRIGTVLSLRSDGTAPGPGNRQEYNEVLTIVN